MNDGQSKAAGGNSSLTPYLTPIGALALAFGFAIGWGAFMMPGTTFLPNAGPLGTIIGLLGGGAVICAIAWCYHAMVMREPGAGGAFTFTKNTFGYDHGFLVGWFLLLTYMAIFWANATALILVFRYTLGGMLQFGFHYAVAGFDVYFGEVIASMLATVLAGWVCVYRKRLAANVQTVLACVMVLGTLVFLFAAIARHQGGFASMAPAFSDGTGRIRQVFHILAIVPWAFVGFEAITNSSAEFKFPLKKTLPILLLSIGMAAFMYLALAILPVLAMPDGYASWADYIRDLPNLEGIKSVPVFAAAQKTLGTFGVALISVTMFAAQFTGLVAVLVATSRLMFAMSEADILPKWFGVLNEDATPRNAIVFITVMSLVIPFFGRTAISWPVDASSIGATVVYGYVSAAAYVAAKEHGGAWARIGALVGIVMSAAFFLLLMIPNYLMGTSMAAESYLLIAIWCMFGFMVYRAVFRNDRKQRLGQSTIVWIALIVMIFFSSLMWIRHMTIDVHDTIIANMQAAGYGIERLKVELDAADMAMLRNSIVELVLLVASLAIMLSLYSILRAKVVEMNKAKSYFFSTVSHDIRTPLNAIIGFSQMLKLGMQTKEEQNQAVGSILVSSKTLLNLLNDVLDLSRLESGAMTIAVEPTSCKTLISDIVKSFEVSNKKPALDIRCKIGDMPTLLIDPHRLRQIVFNLVGNAVKFTERGVVEVRATFKPDANNTAGTFCLEVEDSGCGISEEDLRRITSPYVQLGSKVSRHGGTGLGLAICRQLAVAMGGELKVESTLGQGSTFSITLASVKTTTEPPSPSSQPMHHVIVPTAQPQELEAVQPAQTAAAEGEQAVQKPRILIADDQKMNLMVLKALLSKLGDFDLTMAKDGKEALEKLEKPDAPQFDMVLTDMWMPEMNGDGLVKAIRANPALASLPVYVITADVETQNTYAKSGFEGILLKPVTLEKLKTLIS